MPVQTQPKSPLDAFPTIPWVVESGTVSGVGEEAGSDNSAGNLTLPEYICAIYYELMRNA
ncbi:MAG: hypothetical protein IJ189_03580 [Clostridia bacterium]|nr:hypothetical protein [Clostridia bacterium]